MTAPVKIGVIGCGNISSTYLRVSQMLSILDIVACADLDLERARARAAEFGVPRACSVEELLADPAIEIVINLTIPRAHGGVALAVLEADKSVYNEKPLAITREEGRHMLDLAQRKRLRIGAAPDTFLGSGLQTCRRLIDQGAIGEPVAGTAFMMGHGHESWHPDPDFYYQPGGGPMFDMGPYYLAALVFLIGPARRVTGSARVTFPTRTITSQPKHGMTITVHTPTHIAGVLDFANGAVISMITSFDVWAHGLPHIEIYGTEGSLRVPDPNGFGGTIQLRRSGDVDWQEVPLDPGYAENSRGVGVADMAYALRSGRPHRANGQMAYHVLDIMHGFHDASEAGAHIDLTSTCARPQPLARAAGEQALAE